jgi:hypothetical protein
MSSPFSAPPRLLGVRLSDTSTTQRHELGSRVVGIDGVEYVYVSAAEAIAAYDAVDYTSAFAASVTDANDIAFGVAQTAIASGSYGWIAVRGVVTAAVTTSLAAGAKIARDCTAGGDLNVVTTGDGTEVPWGVALSAESGGTATLILF